MKAPREAKENASVYLDGALVLPARRGTQGVWKAFRYRLFPKPAQARAFMRLFESCRFVYNHFLAVRTSAWEAKQADPSVRIPSRFDMCKALTQLKSESRSADGRQFLREVDSTALVYELAHLEAAFDGFFRRVAKGKAAGLQGSAGAKGGTAITGGQAAVAGATSAGPGAPGATAAGGQAAGKPAKAGFPRPKTKASKEAATIAFPNPAYLGENRVRFAKVGWVRANIHRPLEGKPVCATISHDAADRWWVSIKCRDVPARSLPATGAHIGLSLGRDPFLVTSEGEVFDGEVLTAPDERQLKRERRKLERRQGPERNAAPSARYEKQRVKVARLYAKEADRRGAELDKLTAHLVETYDTIVVRDTGAHEFLSRLRYKCAWAGRAYVELPPVKGEERGGKEERQAQAKRDLFEGLRLLERVAEASGSAAGGEREERPHRAK